MNKTQQRAFILGAVIEFVGIISLAVRFGANRGGTALLILGGAVLAVGVGIQVRAIVQARRSPLDADTPHQ